MVDGGASDSEGSDISVIDTYIHLFIVNPEGSMVQ